MEPKIGDRFGRLTVAGAPISKNGRYWPCSCDCGGTALIPINALRERGLTNGGCISCCRIVHGHGKSTDPTYSKYQAMKQRCHNSKHKSYMTYGGRGIEVCERWMNFDNFLTDMGNCPKGMSIDRRDSDGNYEPGNCHWATDEEQRLNKRSNVAVTFNGVTYDTLKQATAELGISYGALRQRRTRGEPLEDILNVLTNCHNEERKVA